MAPIWRIVTFAYATASPLTLDGCPGQYLISSNGVRQGDPLSSLLFCLYIRDALTDVMAHTPVQVYGFMDDLHVVGGPEQVMQALEGLTTSLSALNLHINTNKSHLAYFHHDTSPLTPTVLSACEHQQIPIAHKSLCVLGAVIAADEAHLTSALQEATSTDYSTTPFFRRLLSPLLSTQCAMLLLRQCGLPKMNYLTRCIPPTCLAAITTAFDDIVADVAFTKMDVRDVERTTLTLDILRRPLRLGGFGMSSMTEAAPSAYIASLAAMATTEADLTTSIDFTTPIPSDSLLHRWIESTIATIRTQLTNPHAATSDTSPCKALQKLPSSPADLFSHFHSHRQDAHRLQHFLTKQATQLRYHAAVEEARQDGDRTRVAHLVSFSAPRASTWKTVIPSHKLHTLSDSHYRVAARFNLGLRPYRTILSDQCASCGAVDILKRDPWHHLSCNGHKRQELTLRHDAIVHALYHHAHYSGAAVAREPAGLSAEDGRRPDLHIVVPDASLLTDVVVSHPLAPSHLSAASGKPLTTANQAAARKLLKYKQLADDQQAAFLPFSVETTGGMAEDAEELISQLTVTCKDHLTLPSARPFANSIRSSIAIAIQRGNAIAIHSGLSRALMKCR